MSQKRKHGESTGGENPQHSFKKPRSNPAASGPRSNHKPHNKRSYSAPATQTTNSLKSRIRDLRRLLEHVDHEPRHKMPAHIRRERERELEACEHDLAAKTAIAREAEHRRKMIGKYHQVRFFDRQKATRILKRLKRELSSLEDDSKEPELLRKIHNAEVDVNYSQYYPLMKAYSSLYPKSKREEKQSQERTDEEEPQAQHPEDVDGPKGDPEMWRTVEQAMQEGTLDALRNSKAGLPVFQPKEDYQSKQRREKKDKQRVKDARKKKMESLEGAPQHKLHETRTGATNEDGDESDGGFFE
ncbi:hypothetical protein BCR34DRAFT_673360 [Clohesyomyces aquaticus]|uniref:rRNA-processing protein EFG1 n=1 Tax=Clohesyomyces aquaticus TaxID=1231657 RepID=A0A1Y1ZQQ5_9PLEO|nr:hypothetical protein BCR34DRAFT_673360 [Clohesyomyces aquaticus]